MPPLKLCILSSEIVPYAKAGGLADVAGALVGNLGAIGHTVRAFMPLYLERPRRQPVFEAGARRPAAWR